MKVNIHTGRQFSYVIIDDVYGENALNEIWQELEFLCHPRKLNPPELTGQPGTTETGKPMKSNKGVWLEETYREKRYSNYLYHLDRMLSKELVEFCKSKDFHFRAFSVINTSNTLVNYYEDTDYYLPHQDKAIISLIYWTFKEPKSFTGGNLKLNDIDAEIELKNNRAVLFPSYAKHEVVPIKMNDGVPKNKCLGRFSVTTFFMSSVVSDLNFHLYDSLPDRT